MKQRNEITAERLRELLNYDPATGIFTWRIGRPKASAGAVAGSLTDDGYWCIRIDGRLYLAHRLAWLHVYGEWPPDELDHEDMIKDHNWMENLRPATKSQNNANTRRRRNNKSGFKGVWWSRVAGSWQAMIMKDRKRIYLGLFSTAEEAGAAYDSAAKQLFGEFARGG